MSTAAGAGAGSSSTTTSSSTGLGGGATLIFAPPNGEPVKSIAEDNFFMAFSITGSTYFNIPSLRSKSATAGIILLRLYIFEKTLING
jgi:hypothetical protein